MAEPAAKGFWFNVNAELIIYGATEPNAKVTLGGHEIKLRSDGTFSFRFALPDGKYDLPAVAVSADGDGRTRRGIEIQPRHRIPRRGRRDAARSGAQTAVAGEPLIFPMDAPERGALTLVRLIGGFLVVASILELGLYWAKCSIPKHPVPMESLPVLLRLIPAVTGISGLGQGPRASPTGFRTFWTY